jgi:xylulokinase
MAYVLTLDAGTTSLKGTLFDRSGRIIASHLEEYALLKPAPGWVEMKAETYWQAAIKAARAVLATSEVAPKDILSLGITSQGETLIVLDREGRHLRNAIVWLDNRSQAEADALGAEFGMEEIYRRTGQQEMVPTWTATRIEWLRRNEPDIFRRTHKYLLVEDYLIYRLTGRHATDRALNPSTLYYDLAAGDWWPEMLQRLGIERGQLPELKPSGAIVGPLTPEASRETGLYPKTRVTTAPLDQVAGTVGAGNFDAGVVTECTGAAMALCATLDRPIYDPHNRVGLYAHAIPGRFVLLPWVPTAGMVLRWFRDAFAAGLDYPALIEEAAAVEPGAEGLLMLPHLCGALCPEADPRARGVFAGITLSHGRGHFVRAILEATAFLMRGNLEMLGALGVSVREIRSIGGAARSDLWLQIKADVCGRDLLVMECEEVASLGTAMLSFVGNGTYRSLEAARAQMVRVRRRITCQQSNAVCYDIVYRRYLDLARTAKGLF